MEVLDVKGDTAIRWYRGDTKTITIVTSDEVEEKENTLKGMRLTFTARERFGKKKVIEKSTILNGDSEVLSFSHEETRMLHPGQYTYDIEIREDDCSVVCTLYTGTLIVEADVTRKENV